MQLKHDVSVTTCHHYQMQMRETMNPYTYGNEEVNAK